MGGVVGGVVLLALLVVAFFFNRQRRRRAEMDEALNGSNCKPALYIYSIPVYLCNTLQSGILNLPMIRSRNH